MMWTEEQMGQYISFQELRESMLIKKREAYCDMIPYGKKRKAKFVGYNVSCWGRTSTFPSFHQIEKCGFGIPYKKVITKKTYKQILEHQFAHPYHEIHVNVGYDYET